MYLLASTRHGLSMNPTRGKRCAMSAYAAMVDRRTGKLRYGLLGSKRPERPRR